MKKVNFVPLSGINLVIYLILIVLSLLILSRLWAFANNIIFKPKEFAELNIERPILRPHYDVFLYLDSEILENDPTRYQKVQRNEFILKTLMGLIFAPLAILITLQLKTLFNSIREKTFFIKKNLKNIRSIAYLMGIWVLAGFILYQSIQFFIPLSLVKESINYVPLNKHFLFSFIFSIDFSLLLAAFAFYVISVVIKEGINLKEQTDLTI